jgi:HECT-like Ubiquitin-conjugating enzyme (E2)-binding/MYND finger
MVKTPCQVCQHPDATLRCKRCRSAYYCSAECQRKDWNGTCTNSTSTNTNMTNKGTTMRSRPPHRTVCHAWQELDRLLQWQQQQQQQQQTRSTLLEREYHLAMDMIERIRKEQEMAQTKQLAAEKETTTTPPPNPPLSNRGSKPTRSLLPVEEDATATAIMFPSYHRIHFFGKDKDMKDNQIKKCYWRFGMEMMPRLSCYQIVVQLPPPPPPPPQDTNNDDDDDTNRRLTQHGDPQLRTTPDGALQVQFVAYHPAHGDYEECEERTLTIEHLPHPIDEQGARMYPMVDVDGNHRYLILRLPYQNDDTDNDDVATGTTIVDAVAQLLQGSTQLAAQLACAFCQTSLVPNPDDIRALAQAPSSRWDELQDYIACGTQADATGLFGKEMQHRRDLILHDATSLAFSVTQPTNTCPLHVPNYGSTVLDFVAAASTGESNNSPMTSVLIDAESLSPSRDATLTCPCCASTLGTATATQQRLFLHRISIGTATTTTTTRLSCISRFLAHVLIEQAESKAVFALRVVVVASSTDEHGSSQQQQQQQQQQQKQKPSVQRTSLLLRLVSWDTFTAVGGSTTGTTLAALATALQLDDDNSDNQPVCNDNTFDATLFRRTVKVLFGKATPSTHNGQDNDNNNNNPAAPILDWTQWTRLDACCAPNNGSNNDTNMVVSSAEAFLPCIELDWDEFDCLEQELLAASALIPTEIAAATARSKSEPGADVSGMRLAAIVV